ncbi:hypothetical protein [Halomonas sp. N3-2A]|uniref:hypothetical protein n=1 Tax=Halomonas sp. N3-2A TaxID=2014541 RepID=UPI000B5B2DF1|nr:hypothetical protein [Halomonas sp. N3-2A]ASK18435.1 hypothetical protein CEK60_03535 [Halomonas sp. N3-2A]
MTDQELLERAARAGGCTHTMSRPSGFYMRERRGQEWVSFNPINDDGDAFRLMIALRLSVSYSDPEENGDFVGVYTNSGYSLARESGVDSAATRRAIVRAAAALPEGL